MCITEESLNHLLAGLCLNTLQPIKQYGANRIQIWFENGAFLSIWANDDLNIDLLGPEPPEHIQLREMWEDE